LKGKKEPDSVRLYGFILFSAPLDEPASKGKYTIITLSKGLQHLDRKKKLDQR
jgi:hypothetical protein